MTGENFAFLVAGFNIGLFVAAVMILIIGRRVINKAVALPPAPPVPEYVDKTNTPIDHTVMQRLEAASQMTNTQNELMAHMTGPSNGALHSKHKNQMMAQWKQMEAQKMALLQSIVNDGHDPMVTVFNVNTKINEEVKLSFFLKNFSSAPAQENPTDPKPPVTEGMRKVEKNGRTFYVIDGGKKTTQ